MTPDEEREESLDFFAGLLAAAGICALIWVVIPLAVWLAPN